MNHAPDYSQVALAPIIGGRAINESCLPLISQSVLHWADADDPFEWSAGMYLPPLFRRVLHNGGLSIEPENPFTAGLPDQLAERLTNAVRGARQGSPESIWAARLLLFMGFYGAAYKILRAIPTGADGRLTAWTTYLSHFLAREDIGVGTKAGLPPLETSAENDSLCELNLRMLALAECIFTSRDSDQAQTMLKAARATELRISEQSDFHGLLAAARITRFLIPLERTAGRLTMFTASVEELRDRIQAARSAPGLSTRSIFLINESERRLLDVLTIESIRGRDFARAQRWSSAAVQLDPYCARARLLSGIVHERLEQRSRAIKSYRCAERYGVIERTFARMALTRLGSETVQQGLRWDLESPRDRNLLEVRKKHLAGAPSTPASVPVPVTGAALEKHVTSGGDGKTMLELAMQPFITLDPPEGPAPVFVQGPLLAMESLTRRPDLWYQSLHLQRAMVTTFRQELAYAAQDRGMNDALLLSELDSWLGLPGGPAKKKLADAWENAAELPLLDRARLARTVSSLGFYSDALCLLPESIGGTDPETAYAGSLRLFILNVLELGKGVDRQSDFEAFYQTLTLDPRCARIRLSTCILGAVTAAQSGQIERVELWRERGDKALAAYVSLSDVNDFEALLLKSRYYRAVSFAPFMRKNKELLISDMEIWLGSARELQGYDDRTRLLARENLFPALESAARTEIALGKRQAGLALMEEITSLVDPLDSKAWFQVGELRQQGGDLDGALSAFISSGQAAVPMGRISWFKAGRCCERLERWDEAVDCYRRSLDLWPTGVAPVQRLQAIARLRNDRYLEIWLSQTPAWTRTSEASSIDA